MKRMLSPKPAEALEAQVGEYIASKKQEYRRTLYSGKHIQQLLGRVAYDSPPSSPLEKLLEDTPVTESVVALNRDDYLTHLRKKRTLSNEREQYAAKTAAIMRYNEEFQQPFHEAVASRSGEPLSGGSYSDVYAFNHQGRPYVGRTIRMAHNEVDEIDKHLSASYFVNDVPCMEHIVAASYADHVTIAPRVPGETIRTCISNGRCASMTNEQLETLYSAMKMAESRGVRFDFWGGNLFYDEEQGFTVIDLSTDGDEDLNIQETTVQALITLIETFRSALSNGNDVVDDVERIVNKIHQLIMREDINEKDQEYLDEAWEGIQTRMFYVMEANSYLDK